MDTNLSHRFRGRFFSSLGRTTAQPDAPPVQKAPRGNNLEKSVALAETLRDGLEKTMTPQQWEETIREGSHPVPFDQNVALNILGSDVSNRTRVVRGLNPFKHRVMGVVMKQMLEKEVGGWKVERVFDGGYGHRESTPEYIEVETALGKIDRVLASGSMILRSASGDAAIVSVHPVFGGGFVMGVLTKGDGTLGSEFFKTVDDLYATNNFYKGQKVDATGRFLKLAEIDGDDLIFPPGMMEELRRNVYQRLEMADQYRQFGLPTKRGLILGGPPGVGKTMALKLLAKQLPCSFIVATPAMLDKAGGVRGLFDFARSVAPAVVSLEDAEVICRHNYMGRDPRLVELLQQLDGVVENAGVTTILTTNYPNTLDAALKDRPGRFDVRMDVPLPGKNEIVKIFQRNLSRSQKARYAGSVESLDTIAQSLANAGASGAYAAEAVTYASILAIEHNRVKDGVLEVTPLELNEAARKIVEYKKQMEAGNGQ
jgi:hypothetical protein